MWRLQHVIVALLFHIDRRLGGLRALDVGNFQPDQQFARFVHCPETRTPLKNRGEGERAVHLVKQVVDLVEDYHRVTRDDLIAVFRVSVLGRPSTDARIAPVSEDQKNRYQTTAVAVQLVQSSSQER